MYNVKSIIDKLGYNNSKNLIYYNDIVKNTFNISNKIVEVLLDINPQAVYFVENKPFILFFEKENTSLNFNLLNKKIWNLQVPIVVINEEECIKVYNGSVLQKEKNVLEYITKIQHNECDDINYFGYFNILKEDFWLNYEKEYQKNKLNDNLLENIQTITSKLKNEYNVKFEIKLVLRIIFIRYLIDRGININYKGFSNDINNSQNYLLKIVKDKGELYKLFVHLKNHFNGNLFELSNEEICYDDDVYQLLHDFLAGTLKLNDKQLSMFPMYDFNIIPVELISNIYELLLGGEEKEKTSAFYTPKYLAKYIVDTTISDYLDKASNCVVLDPACGSGIFLVESFRRILEKNLNNERYFKNSDIIKKLLIDNIFGIDINEDAIDITIFSLYLVMLDYKDPKNLNDFKFPNLKGKNLFVSDFFDTNIDSKFKNKKIDIILGNPPWGSKEGLHILYCKNKGYEVQDKEISRSFIYRAFDLCNKETTCLLLVNSKLLYNMEKPALKFRKFMLTNTRIESIIELSKARKLIFKNAICPAMVIKFKKDNTEYTNNTIKHIAFKPNIFFNIFNIIVLEKNDVKYIKQKFLYDNDWAFKTILYGTSFDVELISFLKDKYQSIKDIINKYGFINKAGININGKDKKDSKHLLNKYIINPKNVDSFFADTNNMKKFDKEYIYRPKSEELFKPPYCIIKKSVNVKTYKNKAVYSEIHFIYTDAIHCIKGNYENSNELLNITGLINSSLYAYLNLMLATSIAVEREQLFIHELINYPYLYSDIIVEKVKEIQECKSVYNSFKVEDVNCLINKLDDYILKLFELENNESIDYALNVQIPMITDYKNSFKTVDVENLKIYSNYFINYFDNIFNKSNKYVKVNLYPNVKNRFTIFELKICDDKQNDKINIIENNNFDMEVLSKFMIYKNNDLFYKIKDLIHFQEDSFYIVKTNEFKNWHISIAKIDLAEVLDDILLENGGI